MRKITFSPDSIAEIAIANCTQSYAINALISSGDTLRIMFHQHSAHNYPHDIVEK